MGPSWGQAGVKLGPSWGQTGAELGSSWGQAGVKAGVNLGSTCTALPRGLSTRCRAERARRILPSARRPGAKASRADGALLKTSKSFSRKRRLRGAGLERGEIAIAAAHTTQTPAHALTTATALRAPSTSLTLPRVSTENIFVWLPPAQPAGIGGKIPRSAPTPAQRRKEGGWRLAWYSWMLRRRSCWSWCGAASARDRAPGARRAEHRLRSICTNATGVVFY